MSIMNRILRWFQSSKGKSSDSNDQLMLQSLIQALDKTEEVEYSCDEVYQLIDQYADLIIGGEDAEKLMPLIKHHLDICKDCHDEYQALIRILESLPT